MPELEPFDTPLLDARMEEEPTTYLEDGLYAIWSVFKQWSSRVFDLRLKDH